LIAILEQIAGESWQAYFERYLLGTDPPPVPSELAGLADSTDLAVMDLRRGR